MKKDNLSFDIDVKVGEYVWEQGYLKNGEITQVTVREFIRDLAQDIVDFLVNNSNMPISSVNYILQYKMSCPFTMDEIRSFCVKYGVEESFDLVHNRILNMIKDGLIYKGTLGIASPVMIKMVMQQDFGYSDKLETKTAHANLSDVAKNIGTKQIPMQKLKNDNKAMIIELEKENK